MMKKRRKHGDIMRESTYKGLRATVLENEFLQLIFLPDYAYKLISLIKKSTGREFLFQSSSDTLSVPPYGAKFSDYDSSGFDEVIPSIDACPYPDGKYKGVPIPDHGEVWAMPWTSRENAAENSIFSSVTSEKLPYRFDRLLTLSANEISILYTVTNLMEEPFEFIWTPHCLLNCSTHTRLLIPQNLTEVITVEHGSQTLGPWGTLHRYPVATAVDGRAIDLAQTRPVTDQNCEKFYFTAKNTAGWAGLEHADNGDKLIYRYDADKVPYLGVWKTQGGYRGDYNLAIEPCTGVYDDLYVAHKIRRAAVAEPERPYSWKFKMIIE